MTHEEWEARVAKGELKNRILAGQIDSNPMLIASIRFYLGALLPTRRAAYTPLYERARSLGKPWQKHMTAARRVLHLMRKPRAGMYELPWNYWERLQMVGLDIFDGLSLLPEFYELNANLVIDAQIEIYSLFHPDVLERTKAFLRKEEYSPGVKFRPPTPPKLDAYGKLLEHRTKDYLADFLGFK